MLLLKNILKKLIRIIFKHLFICVLIAYTPLPFFDILNFYNQEDPLNVVSDDTDINDNQDQNDDKKKKIKIFLLVCSVLLIAYILYKSNTEVPRGTGASKNTNVDISNILKAQQDLIMQKRMDNALSTTRKILEIKKRV